jgi:hypothetical protein
MCNSVISKIKKTVRFSPVKSVRFCSDILPARQMSNTDRERIWYSPRQLEEMKNEARVRSREFRLLTEKLKWKNTFIVSCNVNKSRAIRRVSFSKTDDISCAGQIIDKDSQIDEENIVIATSNLEPSVPVCPRGLEQRVYFERQKNKIIAQRAVIEYHQRLQQQRHENKSYKTTSNHCIDATTKLAFISSKCTRWARDVAIICGKNDFAQAYPEFALSQKKPNINGIHMEKILPFPNIFKKRSKEHSEDKRKVRRRHSLPYSDAICEGMTIHKIPI